MVAWQVTYVGEGLLQQGQEAFFLHGLNSAAQHLLGALQHAGVSLQPVCTVAALSVPDVIQCTVYDMYDVKTGICFVWQLRLIMITIYTFPAHDELGMCKWD